MWIYIRATLVIILIIVLAYYVTRFVAVKGPAGIRRNPDIKIRATTSLGRDKQIVIAEIGTTAYILGVTGSHVELIDTVNPQELDESCAKEPEPSAPQTSIKQEFWERLKGTYKDPRL